MQYLLHIANRGTPIELRTPTDLKIFWILATMANPGAYTIQPITNCTH